MVFYTFFTNLDGTKNEKIPMSSRLFGIILAIWLYSRLLIQFPTAVRELHIAATIFAYSTA